MAEALRPKCKFGTNFFCNKPKYSKSLKPWKVPIELIVQKYNLPAYVLDDDLYRILCLSTLQTRSPSTAPPMKYCRGCTFHPL